MRRGLAVKLWLPPMFVAVSAHAALALVPLAMKEPPRPNPAHAPVKVALHSTAAAEPVVTPAPEPPPPPPPPPPRPARKRPRKKPAARPVQPKAPVEVEALEEPEKVEPEQAVPEPPAEAAETEPPAPSESPAEPEPVDTEPADLSAARPPPRPEPGPPDLGPYRDGLYRALLHHRRYPRVAERMGYQGVATVRVKLGASGRLANDPVLVASSGYDVLDREALRMVRAAAPFGPLPPGAPGATFDVPVQFALAR